MGKVKSTVLYHKNGTLAEDRFKKLTPLQWLFHYYEIITYKTEEVGFINNITDAILDRLETLWYTTNPAVGKELIEHLKKGTINEGEYIDGISPDTFHDRWQEIMVNIPSVLEIPDAVDRKKKGTYHFPTFSKEQLRKKSFGLRVEY